MKYKAIIFDMDGTVIYSEHLWYAAALDLLDDYEVSLTQQEKNALYNEIVGKTTEESCRILKEMAHLTDNLDIVIEKALKHTLKRLEEVVFVDGFLSFYEQLTAENIPIAIATNADSVSTQRICEILPLKKLFNNHIYTASDVIHGKPCPDVYLLAAQKLGIEPTACIAIEDSDHGLKAAKDAGMFCIGINTLKQPERLATADMIINTYHDLNLNTLLK